jgi:hypothetical protein
VPRQSAEEPGVRASTAPPSAAMPTRSPVSPDEVRTLQAAVGNRRTARLVARAPRTRVLQRSATLKALKFAGKWLAKREAKEVSGHIARHGRRIAGRVIHSVFRSPKDIRWLLDRTLRHATEAAERNAAQDVIVEEGIRIERQGTRRWVIDKTFRSAIGTAGETVLRVIVNFNGRIVTAYPLRALAVLGIVGAAAEMFDEKVAQASEGVAAISQEAALRATARDSSWFGDWEDWIPYLGDIYGGTLNEDEDLLVREDQLIYGTVNALQQAAQQTWTPETYQAVAKLVRSAVAAPYFVDDDSPPSPEPTGLLSETRPDALATTEGPAATAEVSPSPV